jgi:hypothetical protein
MYKRLVAMLVAAILAAVSLIGVVSSPAIAQVSTSNSLESVSYQDPIIPPKIVGTVTVGSRIYATFGKWPFKTAFGIVSWYKETMSGESVKIGKNQAYVVKASDLGSRIYAEVIAYGLTLANQGRAYTKSRIVK